MRTQSILLASAMAVLFAGCASKSSDGYSGPASSSSSGSGITTLRKHRETKLANGLQVLFIPDQSLPSMSMGLLVKSGSSVDPMGSSGLASLVSDLLDQGTKRRNSIQISDELAKVGASFQTSVDYDYTYVSLTGLSFSSEKLLSNFFELTTQPSFPDSEFTRIKKQTVASLTRAFDNPRVVADVASSKWLFGSHVYGRSVSGSAKEVAALTKKNVIQHYLKYFRPGNSILVVVGQFDEAFEAKVQTVFGDWSNRAVPAVALEEPKPLPGIRVQVVDKPGLSQAQIRFSAVGIRRKDADFLKLRLANTVLGGAFASRLNDRIRKELGLTYSISSGFESRVERGPFEIDTFTKVESIEKVVTETIALYKKFIESGITSEELKRARGYMSGIFPQAIETSDKLAFNMLLLRNYGIPDRYLTHYIHDLEDISVSEVNSAIRRAMQPDALSITIHAPAASAEAIRKLATVFEVVPVSAVQ